MRNVLVKSDVIGKPGGVSCSSTAACPPGQQWVAQAGTVQTLTWPEETPRRIQGLQHASWWLFNIFVNGKTEA